LKKILVLSRYHDDDANSIYNSFLKGVSKVRDVIFIDYFDSYTLNGKKNFELEIESVLNKYNIAEIFIMFVSGDATLDIKFLEKITANRYTYMIFWDLEQFFEPIDRYYAQLANEVLLPSNKGFKTSFELLGIKSTWTFSIFDSEKYKKDFIRDIDVSFVGEMNKGNRKEYINYLKNNGINIEVYGSGSENGKASFEKMIEVLNRSKISLNFSDVYDNSIYSFCNKINNRIKQTKGKVAEVCMTGAFLLTEDSDSLEDVVNRDNIGIFSTKEELLEKIKHYLNSEEMISKAKLAQEEVIKKFDSDAISKIFEQEKKSDKKREIILDNKFLKIYRTFHFFYFLEYLYRGMFRDAFEELKIIYKGILFKESIKYFITFHKDNKKYFNFYKQIKNRKLISKNILNLESTIRNKEILLSPAGDSTRNLIDIFNLQDRFNIKNIVDDYSDKLNYSSINEIDIINSKEIKDGDIVVITNYNFAKIIEDKLNSLGKDIKVYNLFHNADYNYLIDSIEASLNSSIYKKRRIDIYKIYRAMFKYK
jgi:hypothetical protein